MPTPEAQVPAAQGESPSLDRRMGAWGGGLLTAGAIIGTGIFLAAGSVAAALPHPVLVLGAWALGGVLTIAGALTYAELGAMFPSAGGLYHFLKEAWGRPLAFLYGWTCLLVIMAGGIAAIAFGFAEYFGALVPFFSSEHLIWSGPFSVSGAQLCAVLAIVLLTGANHVGLRTGAAVQHVLTIAKIATIAGLIIVGISKGRTPEWSLPLTIDFHSAASGIGVALVAVLWTFDGWYALTFTAGEVREPENNLPRGLVYGVSAVSLLYLAMNFVYLCALPLAVFAQNPRAGSAAATALAGPFAGTVMTGAVAVSAFGCLAATILYSSRLYQPIAAEGLFFAFVARIHPRWRTPVAALWLQSSWAVVLVLSGSYERLFTYVTFAGTLFHVAAGLALFRLRRTLATAARPYRTWGYPVVPIVFISGMALLTVSTLLSSPTESILGLGLIAAGLPAYLWWSRATNEASVLRRSAGAANRPA